ncbi:ribonuclease H-like domain-containing protein [Tanacetum coccineum]
MVTRFRVGTNRPTKRLNLHVSSVSPLPKSYRDAFSDPNWQNTIRDEYHALIKNKTWTLVPRPPDTNIVCCMCLFRHKYLADGTLSRYKARLVANGSTQLERVDVDETFSPVVKPGTIRTVLSLATSRNWPIHQLDVKNAFLHGDLSDIVYMYQPPGFWDSVHPDYVCLLQRSLYGLKQAPRAWFQHFSSYITRVGFSHSRCDSSLFIYRQGTDIAYLLLYVDDIVLTASFEILLQRIIRSLHQEFAMTDLGPLNYFLGRIWLNVILVELLLIGDPVSGLTLYRSLAALKRILRYVRGTLDFGLQLFSSSTINLVAYLDADWAGCPTTRHSTSGYCVFLGNNLLPWSSKRQPTLSRSSAEAEYRGVANVVTETCWLRNLLHELHTPLSSATLVYCDNVRVLHVPSRYQYVDIFTKGLPSALFEEFHSSLSIRCSPAPTTGEY